MPTKTKRTTRKKRTEDSVPIDKKAELKAKFRAKLHEAQMSRQSQASLDNRLDTLEERLEKSKSHEERKKIRAEMDLIDKIEENRASSFNGDFADYGDNAGYGGSMEHPD